MYKNITVQHYCQVTGLIIIISVMIIKEKV